MESLDLQQLELIFYFLLGLILITLITLVTYVILANRRERARLAEVYDLDKISPRPALHVTGQVLALVRDVSGGPLNVEIEGKHYRRLSDIQDPEVRRQVIESAMELIQFTGVLGEDAAGISSVTEEKTYSWREDVRQGSRTELERIHTHAEEPSPSVGPSGSLASGDEAEEQFLNLLSEIGPGSAPGKPSLMNALQRRRVAKTPDEEQPRTFVDDIESIIQRRIQLIPALARRDLHVRSGPGGSVRFIFEGQEYESLEDLPNLTARQLVKDAIREWDETT